MLVDSKQIEAFIEVLEYKESQLKDHVLDQVPARDMVPAVYGYVIGGLKGMIANETKD